MKDYVLYTIRLDHKMHEEVCNLAHFLKIPMSEIIRESINLKLNQIGKVKLIKESN